jgi:alginate O-acetyltransferase complex protein AlgI
VFDGSLPTLDANSALQYLSAMFGQNGAGFADGAFLFELVRHAPLLTICALCLTPLPKRLFWHLYERHRFMDVVTVVLCVAGLLFCTAYLVDSSYNPFLYFRF